MDCEYELVLQVKIFLSCHRRHGGAESGNQSLCYGSAAMSSASVYRWYARFRDGREDVKDDARSGRPSTARTDENVESVRRLLTEGRRITLQVMADRLNVGKESVRRIVTEDLGKKKDLLEICSSRLDHREETRTRCLLP